MPVDLSAVEEEVRQLALDAMERAGDDFVEMARDRAPRKTGELIAAIMSDGAQASGDGVTVHVHCDVEYASYQDEGVDGRIEGDPLLAFELDGELVIVRSTSGVPATNFWSDTFDQGEAIIAEAFG